MGEWAGMEREREKGAVHMIFGVALTNTRARARTHTHTHTRAHAHTCHTLTHTHTRSCHQFAGGFDPEATALFSRLHSALSPPAAAADGAAEGAAHDTAVES